MAFPEIGAWRVEALRYTFFFSEPQSGRGGDWWKGLTGIDPESVTSKPQAGEHSETGSYLDGQLELKVAFNRVDWVLSYPFASLPDVTPGMNVESVIEKFLPDIVRWLGTQAAAISRVAIGVITLLPVETVSRGNLVLSSYYPYFKFDPETATDVFLQINHPQKTAMKNVQSYNFIKRVGVVTGQFMQLSMGGLPQMTTNHLFRSEFDISTPPDQISQLPFEDIVALLRKFSEDAIKLLKEGA
ncbi:hypothetical protein [Pseudomonas sivasensis]|uniref:hypothetical protein n=1 Tax=Pseudomonas sivasensis TaxID=1880678 RepID=UPI0030D7F1CC